MSTLKVDTLDTSNGTGNITLSRPIVGDGSNLTGISPSKATIEALGIDVPAANITSGGTLPVLDGSNLTGVAPTKTTIEALGIDLPAANLTGSIDAARIPEAAVTQHVTPFDPAQLEMNMAILAFKVASANQLAKFQMVDQVIDEYQDATGIDAGNSYNEYAGGSGTAKYYFGGVPASTTTTVKSYTGANQTFVVPSGVATLTFKAWGAGGGSGGAGTAIGGGGGFIQEDISVTAGETLNVKVGGGGQRIVNGPSRKGGGGGWTSIDRAGTFLAGAGAGGGGGDSPAGGAGGGTTGANGSGSGAGLGGTQSAGGAGGNTHTIGSAGSLGTGGRAGVGSAVDATGGYNGGGLGDGDNATWTAGGGGAGYYGGGGASNGGGGGGSSYAPTGTNIQASAGTVANGSDSNYQAGTGNGGSPNNNGQHGAAVLICTGGTPGDNLILQSEATTAESTPTSADLVVLIEDGAGTATVNSDIKGYVSRNGSAFSSAVTFVDEGDWGTNKRILVARNVDISGITSGTSMKYKLTTHNQVASSLETRIHATSLAWA